jgi:hypothetical protein
MSQIHTFAFAVNIDTVEAWGHTYTTKIIPIDVPKNCIKYAENALLDAHVGESKMPKIIPNLSFYIGKNLHKIEEKTRLQCVADAYAKTFA